MPIDVDAVVRKNRRLSDTCNVLTLDAPALAELVQPGQFVMVRTSRGCDPLLRRPFSIFEVEIGARGATGAFSILNKRVGAGTTRVYDARTGDRLPCLGPLGRPFEPVSPPAEAWMVAGGVGIAPFATLTAALAARGTVSRLFYGARSAAELHGAPLFERAGVRLTVATEDGSRGTRGFISVPLDEALRTMSPAADLTLYVCGPTPMMRAVARLAASYRRPCRVSLEPIMGCGLGGCYSCVVPTKTAHGAAHYVRSCLEGPVFDANVVVWEELGQ